MILHVTQTQIEQDPKLPTTSRWLQTLQPDQTVPLLSTTDDCYRPDDDYCDDDDGTDSMPGSDAPSAGGSTAVKYTRTMEKNKITDAGMEIDLEVYELDVTFTDKALLETAANLPGSHLTKVKEVLNNMAVLWDRGKYNNNEWHFHYMMHGRLHTIIEPEACDPRVPEHTHGWGDFESTSPGEWNFTSKVISDRCKDLSRPKVDDCFSLSMDQDKTEKDTPLFRICHRVEHREYRSQGLRGIRIDFKRAAVLLSLTTLREFNKHDRLRKVCFCPKTQIRTDGNYPISWFELKWTPGELPVCVNQIVNANVFQCGKQIDLINEATSLGGRDLPKSVVCLGMCITGKEWKMIATASSLGQKLGAAFIYGEICSGNWQTDPEKFIGAVIAMHEHNENRTVRLLVKCFGIFQDWVTKQPPQQTQLHPTMLDRLPERVVPSTFKKPEKPASGRSASAKSDAASSKLDTVLEQHNEG